MKLGIVGKGGVGKTTVSALLASAWAARGRSVVAIDTDSNPNLGLSLGLDLEATDAIPVLPRAVVSGSGGGTQAAALLRDYGRPTPAGVTLLSALRVTEAGAGCTCSGHATVRTLLGDVLEEQADVAIVDMEAGLEHLSRSGGTLAYADALLVVVEPTRKAVATAARTAALAAELGIPRTYVLGNKARPGDAGFFTEQCQANGLVLAGVLPLDPAVGEADRRGTVPVPGDALNEEVARVVDALDAELTAPRT